MYGVLLVLHSWSRWIVVVAGVSAVAAAIAARGRDEGPATFENFGLAFMIAADVQLLLGLALFAVTPWLRILFESPGAAMSAAGTRFWSVEHAFGMIIAIALIHIGRVRMRKTTVRELRRRSAIVWSGLALLIVLATMPWPFMAYGRPLFRI